MALTKNDVISDNCRIQIPENLNTDTILVDGRFVYSTKLKKIYSDPWKKYNFDPRAQIISYDCSQTIHKTVIESLKAPINSSKATESIINMASRNERSSLQFLLLGSKYRKRLHQNDNIIYRGLQYGICKQRCTQPADQINFQLVELNQQATSITKILDKSDYEAYKNTSARIAWIQLPQTKGETDIFIKGVLTNINTFPFLYVLHKNEVLKVSKFFKTLESMFAHESNKYEFSPLKVDLQWKNNDNVEKTMHLFPYDETNDLNDLIAILANRRSSDIDSHLLIDVTIRHTKT